MLQKFATERSDLDFEMLWAEDAPKGGKTVLNRVLKEGASVPLNRTGFAGGEFP